jgi:hypothetical protein
MDNYANVPLPRATLVEQLFRKEVKEMLPGFTAEASLYQTNNHYRSAAGGSVLRDGNATVTPQDCGWIKGSICGGWIAAGIPFCSASCVIGAAGGGIPCWICWTGFLGGLYGYCRDCLPGWISDLLDLAESGGGGGGGGGGGSPQPVTCPSGTRCCDPVNGLCQAGACFPPSMQCP